MDYTNIIKRLKGEITCLLVFNITFYELHSNLYDPLYIDGLYSKIGYNNYCNTFIFLKSKTNEILKKMQEAINFVLKTSNQF